MRRGFECVLRRRLHDWPQRRIVWLVVAGSLAGAFAPVRAQGGGDVFDCTLTAAYQLPGLEAPSAQDGRADPKPKLRPDREQSQNPNRNSSPNTAPAQTSSPGELLAVAPPLRHFMVDRRSGRAWSDAGPLVPEDWSVEVEDLARAEGAAAPYRALMRDPEGALSLFTVVEATDAAHADAAVEPTLRPLFARYPARWLTDQTLWLAVCRLIPARVQE